jgi:hypothetical protein
MAIDKITASGLGDGGVSTADIADGAVTAAKITDGEVTDAKIASGITSSKLTGALPAIDGSSLTGVDPADGSITTAKLATDSVTTAKIADANITTAKLNDNLVHTVKLSEAEVTSSVSSYDILLDPTNYDRYILYIRDLATSNSAYLRIQKLISAGVTGDNCYGGGRWAGEGLEAGGQYTNQPGYYFLGDTTRVSNDVGAYKASWRFDIVNQTDGKQNITGHGAHRQGTGQATNITSGMLNINGGANYGIRIDSSGTLTMRYTLYGVKQI